MSFEDKMTDTTVSRRTVLRTAAWSAPVITVMAAAPAFAVSGEVEGPQGGHGFNTPPGTISVIAGGQGLVTYFWEFKNTGSQPLSNVKFIFPTKGFKRWIAAAGLVKVGPGVFVYNGVVAPGQTIQLSVSAVPKKKNRRKRRLVNLARRNSNAVASADNAGTKPVLFRITEVNGRRKRRRGGHFSS